MKYLIIFSFVFITACSNNITNKHPDGEADEFHTLLSNILKINQNKYSYIDEKGEQQADSLMMFKELERIYIKNIEPDLKNSKFSHKRLKIIMLFSFYAYEHKSAAFQEYLASDLMPIYMSNKVIFLQTLKDLPFLIQPGCNRLGAYFGHEGNMKIRSPHSY